MKITKKFIAVICATFFMSSIASAADLKIGFVDLQKALTHTKMGAKAQKDFEAEVKGLQEKVEAKKGEYDKALADYNKQKESLNTKARQEKEEAVATLEKEWKRLVGDSQEQIRRKNNQVVGDFAQKLRAVVQAVGKEEGFSAVYDKNMAIYTADALDVTDKVVKKFDEVNK